MVPYRKDGRLLHADVNILGERAITKDFAYFDDGTPKSESTQLLSTKPDAAACLNQFVLKVRQVIRRARSAEGSERHRDLVQHGVRDRFHQKHARQFP